MAFVTAYIRMCSSQRKTSGTMVKSRPLPSRSVVTDRAVLWKSCGWMAWVGGGIVDSQMARDALRAGARKLAIDMALGAVGVDVGPG